VITAQQSRKVFRSAFHKLLVHNCIILYHENAALCISKPWQLLLSPADKKLSGTIDSGYFFKAAVTERNKDLSPLQSKTLICLCGMQGNEDQSGCLCWSDFSK
jgi:hypothetical protein